MNITWGVMVCVQEKYHDELVREWLKSVTDQYQAIFHVEPEQVVTPARARVEAM